MPASWVRLAQRPVPRAAGIVAVVGILARFVVSTRGFNFDWQSWQIIADIGRHHGDIYAQTTRYNYGPVSYWFMGTASTVIQSTGESLRLVTIAALTITDGAIAVLLWRAYGGLVAAIFFLNPVSIIISGYHNQFDNVGIAFGLIAVVLYGTADGSTSRRKLGALAMLGLSLATKHVLFAFPLWIAFKEPTWRARLTALVVPGGVFLVAFVPFLPTGWDGIVNNVFLFRAEHYSPLQHLIVPGSLRHVLTAGRLFAVGLVATGWWWRRVALFESVILYLVVLVVFSSAASNQFLAIPAAAAAAYLSPLMVCFLLFCTWFLLGDENGLHLIRVAHSLPPSAQTHIVGPAAYDWPVGILALALAAIVIGYDRHLEPRRRQVPAVLRRLTAPIITPQPHAAKLAP